MQNRCQRANRWNRRGKRLGLVFLAGAGLLALASLALRSVPLPNALFNSAPAGLEVIDRHGRTLRELPDAESHFGQPVHFRDLPPLLIQATLSAEDKRFWEHGGVDWRASLRAAVGLVRHRRVVSGGSTVTQQLIKLAEPRPRTWQTKIIESLQAMRLEQVWAKERILVEYLNRLPYGNLCVGPSAAAGFYFGKPLRDLSAAEAAFLAGLPQAPSRFNPHRNADEARRRQRWVLQQMHRHGFLNPLEYELALAEPLQLHPPFRAFQAPHFVDLLLASEVGLSERARGPVRTTLDLDLNRFAEQTLRSHLARLREHQVRNGAVVVLDNASGDVLGLVGSEDYFAPDAGQVNGAWAPRSAGSTLKPFTYLLAFEQGANPASVMADVPTEFATPTGLFAPQNYHRRCLGPVRYRLALANSLNIPAVKVLAAVGGPAMLQARLQAGGLTTLTRPAEEYGLGLTLGNAEVRLLELANAYAAVARLGQSQPYRFLTTPAEPARPAGGASSAPAGAQVWQPDAAWLVADILSDHAARLLAFGAESPLHFDFPVACKTGTSSDFRDNWAVGYTPEFTVAVWVGNFDGSPMERVSGVSGAAPVLHDLFVHLRERLGTSWYAPRPGIVEALVHPLTGKRLVRPTPDAVREKFVLARLPPEESERDYDPAGRVRLGAEYRRWFLSADHGLANRAVLDEAEAELRLVSPLPGTIYYLDPDLPAHSQSIRLEADGPAGLKWASDSLECRVEGGQSLARLRPGRHHLTVLDPASHRRLETWILVRTL